MWIFEKRSPYSVVTVPKNDEFFASDKRDISQSLVREVSQNSGDAFADPAKPVLLSFDFGYADRDAFAKNCLVGLRDHLDACSGSGIAGQILDESGPVRFLRIEDFDTTGLTGDYGGGYVEKSNFINFWRRYGESSKGGVSGGRHGIGKSTISSASQLRFFFGATLRADDGKLLLYGQSTLRPHRLPDDDHSVYDPYGLFSFPGSDGTAAPFEGEGAAWFLTQFGLNRQRRPGLSLVIPFPRVELTEESILRAAIEHCFHQIISGHLVIRVGPHELSRSTLRNHAESISDLHELLSAIDLSLAATAMTTEDSGETVFTPRQEFINEPLAAEHFAPTDLEAMKTAWAQGSVVRVSLPVSIKPKGQPDQQGEIKLFIRHEADSEKTRETCVRGRVTVIGRNPDAGKFAGLFIADDGIASQFLGDAEPPAHDRWLQYKAKERYERPERAFRRLILALRNLYGIISEADENAPIRDALTKYFWVPREKEKGVADNPPPPPVLPPPEGKTFRVGQIAGGFVFARKRGKDVSPQENYLVSLCYDTRHGRPKWDPADFSFGDGRISLEQMGKGDVFTSDECGEIRITDAEPGFELRVIGFDPRRDLLVEAKEIKDGR